MGELCRFLIDRHSYGSFYIVPIRSIYDKCNIVYYPRILHIHLNVILYVEMANHTIYCIVYNANSE